MISLPIWLFICMIVCSLPVIICFLIELAVIVIKIIMVIVEDIQQLAKGDVYNE